MKLIPIGIENFKEMIDKNYYYIDKTNLIIDFLNEQVIFCTRPRRFGKTLNMSMLYYFFSIKEKENAYLFDHLNISKNKEALKHQNKYPTILISLKEMKSSSFKAQIISFSNIIYELLEKNLEILSSAQLTDTTKKKLNSLHDETTSIEDLKFSLRVISNALYTHYHQKVIVLIDEYDVPLQSAYQNNYYDEMVDFLRSVFSSALKTNDALEKGIMTGCLRISKESIFTGLNNFTSYSLLNNGGSEYFGFNEKEVKQLLEDYQLSSYMDEVKEWYDGYLFGNIEIYNPWSTLMYVKNKIQDQSFKPVSFWANTSGNDLVVNYIQNGDRKLRQEFESLMNGHALTKYIRPELTYREMDNINNIYSFLLLTGYLRVIEDLGENKYRLVIPNKEVYDLKAQAVAARTYALNKGPSFNHPDADLCTDYACCQAWIARDKAQGNWGDKAAEYTNKITTAVAETGNQVILYQGQLIDAVFHSSSSAATQDAVEVWGNSVPYLQSVDSPEGEGVPNSESQVTLTTQEFKDAFLKAQPTASLEGDPASWVGTIERTQSGSVHAITIGGVTVSGAQARQIFSLRSASFDVSLSGDTFTFSVTGFGHGVGMSQYGADAMAEEGKGYVEILQHYYTGVTVEECPAEYLPQ